MSDYKSMTFFLNKISSVCLLLLFLDFKLNEISQNDL